MDATLRAGVKVRAEPVLYFRCVWLQPVRLPDVVPDWVLALLVFGPQEQEMVQEKLARLLARVDCEVEDFEYQQSPLSCKWERVVCFPCLP